MKRVCFYNQNPNTKFVALVVRGKMSADHNPGLNSHADCLLPDGSPVGYFQDKGVQSGGESSGSWHSVGLNRKGLVVDYRAMRRVLQRYTDVTIACRREVYSTVLLVEVDTVEALVFTNYWSKLKEEPDGFRLLGNNCSTHASKAFIKAKIVDRGIPGLDTPNNLYRQLVKLKNRKVISYSGFVGHTPNNRSGYVDLLISER